MPFCHNRDPSCKMEKGSGYIMQLGPPIHPPTQPPHQLEIHLGISGKLKIGFFQCCVVSPPQFCPPLRKYVWCRPFQFFSVWVNLPTLSYIFDSKWSMNLAQLVFPSVALLAELVWNGILSLSHGHFGSILEAKKHWACSLLLNQHWYNTIVKTPA